MRMRAAHTTCRDVISRRHRHPCARAPIPLRPRCCSGGASSPPPRLPLCPRLSPPNRPPSLRSARTYMGAELVWAQLSWGRRRPCSALLRPVSVSACTCPSLHVRRAEHQPARPQSTHPALCVPAPWTSFSLAWRPLFPSLVLDGLRGVHREGCALSAAGPSAAGVWQLTCMGGRQALRRV